MYKLHKIENKNLLSIALDKIPAVALVHGRSIIPQTGVLVNRQNAQKKLANLGRFAS
jgi:hypothetical protein